MSEIMAWLEHDSLEILSLMAAMVLGLIHLSFDSFAFKAQVGNKYSVGARDEALQPTGLAGRFHRAHTNFRETFPYFAASVLVLEITGTAGVVSAFGCLLYLSGRILYLPLYALGVPWLRTFSWNIATFGVVLVGAQYFVR